MKKEENKSNENVEKELEEKIKKYWEECVIHDDRKKRIAMGKKMKKLMKGNK